MLRFAFRDDLRRGAACGCAKAVGTCRELLAGETHLWTFVRVEGVEPANNDAERVLRHGAYAVLISASDPPLRPHLDGPDERTPSRPGPIDRTAGTSPRGGRPESRGAAS
jgi:hypothetical protein